MPLRRVVLFSILVLLVAGCGTHADNDQLGIARRNLKVAPCGSTPAVAGVAGVNSNPRDVYVGDWIVVAVCHADKLMKESDAEQAPVTLFIEGRDSINEPVGIDTESGTLTFILGRNDKNRDLWRPFLYDPLFDPVVSMHLSVGVRGERPLQRVPRANMTVHLEKIWVDWTTWLWLAGLLVLIIVLYLSARNTDMLREGPAVDGVKQPFNLGRTQMAWWFFLIVGSYCYIWLVLGDRDTIPASLLGLMGISAGTALAVVLIAPATARASRGFWRDLLTSSNGAVALDRLQIVVWTLVLGAIFLTSVVWELTMPEFSVTMLALMGISSGTYIGFQYPQRNDAPANPPAQSPPAA
jgi:hypothetical protein